MDAFVRPKSPAVTPLGAPVLPSTLIEEADPCGTQSAAPDPSGSQLYPFSQSGEEMLDVSCGGSSQGGAGREGALVESSSQVATASSQVAKRRRTRKPARLTSIQELQERVLGRRHRGGEGTQCAGGRYIHKHCCTFTHTCTQTCKHSTHTHTHTCTTHTHTTHTQTHAYTHTHHTHTPHTHTHTHSCPLWVCSYCAAELTELFKEHKFVGCVDQTRALVQFLVSCLGPQVGDSTVSCVSSYIRMCMYHTAVHPSVITL